MIFPSLILILLLIGPALASIAFLRSPSTRVHLLLFSICIFYGIFPLLLTWGGINLTEQFGPSWHRDIVTGMFFAHWLAIFTIPSAILGALGLLLSWILKNKRLRPNATISGRPSAIFRRSRRHKVIAGLCSAISQRWELPIQAVRIVTVVLAIIVPGLVVLSFYLWGWLAFPLESPIEAH
ncbi:MAG: PspC domain-containing protein [Coleofasciculaceae cyanobacterium]|jgi:phage shock protein C